MREIKFRAMTDYHDGNRWVYGQYAYNKETDEHFIVQSLSHVDSWEWNAYGDYIDVKTLGQFTGVVDKHGKEIYEGDIVKFDSEYDQHIGVVTFSDSCFQIGKQIKGDLGVNFGESLSSSLSLNAEVIGNIHEEK